MSGGGGGSSLSEAARAGAAFGKLVQDALMPAADWMESNGVGDAVAGFGDSLSFGLSGRLRSAAGWDAVDRSSDAYGNGEMTGVIFSLGFGVAHIGRNLAAQGWKVAKMGWDPRSWGRVRSVWSKATGGLKNKGQHLHHWLFPKRAKGIPQGLRNAGFNYLPLSAGFNSWMNGSTATRIAVEWGFKGVVLGIYGAPATAAINGD